MDPPHPYWAYHSHSDEHLNEIFIFSTPASEPPHPYSADHTYTYSDAHLNRIPTYLPEETDPPHRYWESQNHNHNHDDPSSPFSSSSSSSSHPHPSYPPTHQQRLLLLPPSSDVDSGYFSPSEPHPLLRRKRKLRVRNKTPTPPQTPVPFVEEESQPNAPARRPAGDWTSCSSEGWTGSLSSVDVLVGEEKDAVIDGGHCACKESRNCNCNSNSNNSNDSNNNNIFSRGFRKARDCIGKAVRVAGQKVGRTDAGVERMKGVDEKAEVADGRGCGVGIHGERRRLGVRERVGRRFGCGKGPVRLEPVKVRFPLD